MSELRVEAVPIVDADQKRTSSRSALHSAPPKSALRRAFRLLLLLLVLLGCASGAAAQLSEAQAGELAQSLAKVYMSGDMQLAVSTFDPLVRVQSPVLPQEAVGVQNVVGFIQANLRAFPDLRVRVKDVFVKGDQMAIALEISGTNSGSLGGLQPTGRAFAVEAMALATVEDGKILRWRDYWNLLELYAALGVPSGPQQAPSRPPGR